MTDQPDYELVRLASGAHSVHARAYKETFHPVIGPAAEAEALYVTQQNLRERVAASHEPFVVWDVGLGAAANAVGVLRATRDLPCRIRLHSFDCTLEPLRFALRHAEILGYFQGYKEPLERLARGEGLVFADGAREVEWCVHVADFPEFLAMPAASVLPRPHAILYDAFSPATNPEMWTLSVFRKLHALLDPMRPCTMPTYSRSTLLRVTLLLAGFFVGAGHATGEKEETTLAANQLRLVAEPLDTTWLQRARRSSSAEPLHQPRYRQAPLSPESWDQLQRHPQFARSTSPLNR